MDKIIPRRVQRKRTKGYKLPDNTIYVGRGSKWGNPFKGEDAVERYKDTINEEIFSDWVGHGGDRYILHAIINRCDDLRKLRGKNLACWCPLDKPCHADILLELVNKEVNDGTG